MVMRMRVVIHDNAIAANIYVVAYTDALLRPDTRGTDADIITYFYPRRFRHYIQPTPDVSADWIDAATRGECEVVANGNLS